MSERRKKPRRRVTAKQVQETENLPPAKIPDAQPAPETDDDEDCDSDGLTTRRKLFVEAITGPARGNATRAAQIAGYASENRISLQNTASRLLGFVGVQRAIARKLAMQNASPEGTRAGIAELADANMANFLRVGPDGQPTFDWAAAAAAGAIGQVREWSEDGFQVGGSTPVIIKRKFKLFDRLRALELQAKINGQLVERRDITTDGKALKGYAIVSPDDWDSDNKPTDPADADKPV